MKHVLEIKAERASTKAAIAEASFITVKDLTTTSGSDPLYAIIDDESMTVSYFNSISSDKTEKYRYSKIESARIALIIALRIAKKIKISLFRRTEILDICVGNGTLEDNWDKNFTEETKCGRLVPRIELRPSSRLLRGKEFDALFKDVDLTPKSHNIAIVNLHYNPGDIAADAHTIFHGATPRAIAIRSMSIKNEEELLGCTAAELLNGLKSEDITDIASMHLAFEKGQPAPEGYKKIPRLPIPKDGRNIVKLVVVKSKKETICVPYSVFLDTIDIPEKLFNATLQKMGLKGELTEAVTLEETPNMISRHQLGSPATFCAVKLENVVRMKVFHVNIATGVPGVFENVQSK